MDVSKKKRGGKEKKEKTGKRRKKMKKKVSRARDDAFQIFIQLVTALFFVYKELFRNWLGYFFFCFYSDSKLRFTTMSSLYPAYKCNKEDWLKKAIDNTTYNPRFDKSIDKAFDETKNKAFCKDKAQAGLNRLREYERVEN